MALFLGDKLIGTNSIGTRIEEKDVNFYDYEGTLVASYTKQEALALTALPLLPDRTSENLTNEGWNWTLAEIKEQLTDVGGIVNVGCTYYTTDGKTHFFVEIDESSLNVTIPLRKNSSSGANVIIDWGDGNTTSVTTTTVTNYSHTYLNTGYYDISFENDYYFKDETYLFGGRYENQSKKLIKAYIGRNFHSNGTNYLLRYSRIEHIIIPSNFPFSANALYDCRNLKHITLPKEQTSIGAGFLSNIYAYSVPMSVSISPTVNFYNSQCFYCRALKSITIVKGATANTTASSPYEFGNVNLVNGTVAIPSSFTTIPGGFLSYLNVTKVILNEGITTIGENAFFYNMFDSITIPSTVTTIGASAFSRCYGLSSVYVKALTPPTIYISSFPTVSYSSSTGINPNCKFYVPRASLTAYQTATNWSDWAANMIPYDFN